LKEERSLIAGFLVVGLYSVLGVMIVNRLVKNNRDIERV
jgi:hypothetical protein